MSEQTLTRIMDDLRTPQRKYALTKVKAGDYLLPSNDGKTIWRITTYEDGPSNGLEIPKDKTFWGVWRWTGYSNDRVDLEDWNQWEMWEGQCELRADAVNCALRMSP